MQQFLTIRRVCLAGIFQLLMFSSVSAQVAINTTGAAPNTSAMLDVSATQKGMLLPRLTTTQRNNINTPAVGLIIYNLNCNEIQWYDGLVWVSGSSPGPVALDGIPLNTTSFQANWEALQGSTAAYFLDVATDNQFTNILPGYNNLNVGNVDSVIVTGITCGTTYYYRVRRNTPCGRSSFSNIVSITPPCCISQYQVSAIPFAPVAGTGTLVPLQDEEVSTPLPIGFSFDFYCTTYTQFRIGSNGFIKLGPGGSTGCCNGECIPMNLPANNLNNIIALSWTDLDPSSGGNIRYYNTGTAPNRKLIIRFQNVPVYFNPGNTISAQVILYETTNVIEVHITSADITGTGNQATIGVENSTGTLGTTAPGACSQAYNLTNVAFRFE